MQHIKTEITIYVQDSQNCRDLLKYINNNINKFKTRLFFKFVKLTKKNEVLFKNAGINKLPCAKVSNNYDLIFGIAQIKVFIENHFKGGPRRPNRQSHQQPHLNYTNSEDYVRDGLLRGIRKEGSGQNTKITFDDEDEDNGESLSGGDLNTKMMKMKQHRPNLSTHSALLQRDQELGMNDEEDFSRGRQGQETIKILQHNTNTEDNILQSAPLQDFTPKNTVDAENKYLGNLTHPDETQEDLSIYATSNNPVDDMNMIVSMLEGNSGNNSGFGLSMF